MASAEREEFEGPVGPAGYSMTRKFIADLQSNQIAVLFALVRSSQTRTKKTGSGDYLSLELQDKTGTVEARIWDLEESMRALRPGDYVKVKGRVDEYRGTLQLVIEKIRKVVDSDRELGFSESDCVISTPFDIDEMWLRLCRLAENEVVDPFIRRLLCNILERTESRFKVHPAAQEIHHGYRGGFLEHVLSVTENCVYFAAKYAEVDKDLLIAGGILHDIGKLEELTPAPAIEYTLTGRLIGHIVLGRDLLRLEAARIPDFPPEKLLLIEHLILSHQGDYEWGSPKRPKIIEALILHYLDDLDAKVNHLQGVLRAHRGSGLFTGYDRILGRVLYKRGDALESDPGRSTDEEEPGEQQSTGDLFAESPARGDPESQ